MSRLNAIVGIVGVCVAAVGVRFAALTYYKPDRSEGLQREITVQVVTRFHPSEVSTLVKIDGSVVPPSVDYPNPTDEAPEPPPVSVPRSVAVGVLDRATPGTTATEASVDGLFDSEEAGESVAGPRVGSPKSVTLAVEVSLHWACPKSQLRFRADDVPLERPQDFPRRVKSRAHSERRILSVPSSSQEILVFGLSARGDALERIPVRDQQSWIQQMDIECEVANRGPDILTVRPRYR